MALKRSIIVQGQPTVNEAGKTATTIKPGYLVKGVSTIAVQTTTATQRVPAAFALERSEFGVGIDDTYKGSGSIAAAYASGDYVKVGVFKPGDRVLAYVASGQSIAEDTYLSSAGDGTLKASTSTDIIARALEAHTANLVSGDAAIIVEIV